MTITCANFCFGGAIIFLPFFSYAKANPPSPIEEGYLPLAGEE
jgi:hypothetical protein